jgi:uncharacterized protein YbaA (DUF1428 family)
MALMRLGERTEGADGRTEPLTPSSPSLTSSSETDSCIEIVESWEDNVPTGKHTDFRRAVDARGNEKIVFTWQVWPDKATLEAAEAKMRDDRRFEVSGDIPFDPKRLILGCFNPIHTMGRK